MRLSKGEKKLFALCAPVIALPMGIGLWFSYINAPPTVNIPAYPSAPKLNGFDFYVAAGRALVPATPPVDAVLDTAPPADAKARARRYSLARKTAWLRANARAFALLERARQTPSLAPSLRPPLTFVAGRPLYEIARAKRVEIHERRLRGDWSGALQSGLSAIQMGHDVRRGGSLLNSILGARWNDDSRAEIMDLVGRVDATQAKSAARRLEKLLGSRWNLPDALTETKYSFQQQWIYDFAIETGGWRHALVSPYSASALSNPARIYLISKQQVVDETGAEFDHQTANARLPYAQKGVPTPPPSGLFLDDFAKSSVQWRFEDARDLAGDRLLMLQLALRAYRLENGAYPAKLQALTPNYLSAVPADPFGNGEPLRYKLSGPNYLLWSIGPDGRDNGGTPVPPNKDEKNTRRLPGMLLNSQGDFAAGKNRAIGFEWPKID